MGSKQRQVVKLRPSGIYNDLPPSDIDLNMWNEGFNFNFRDGIATRVGGYKKVFPMATEQTEHSLNVPTPLVNYWMYMSSLKMHVTDGITINDITPVAPQNATTEFNQWTSSLLNGIPIVNNPFNDPKYWDLVTANPAQSLPGWPAGTVAQAVRAFKYHIVAMNITDGGGDFPSGILWSDAAQPGAVPTSWTAAPGNEAGSAQLSDSPGAIVDGFKLRDSLIIYKNAATYAMQYVGGNEVFSIRKILESSGMLSRNCCVEVLGAHIVLTQDDVILFDGNSATSMLDGKNKRWLFQTIDSDHWQNSFVCVNTWDSEVWVCFPTQGNIAPNMALVYSRVSNNWGVRTLPNAPWLGRGIVVGTTAVRTWLTGDPIAWEDTTGSWSTSNYTTASQSLLMTIDGDLNFYNIDADVTNDGVNVSATLTKLGIDLDTPEIKKLLKRVWPRFEGIAGTVIQLRCGSHNNADDAVSWSAPVDFTIGTSEKVDSFAQGRFLAVQFSSDSVQPYRLMGFDIEYVLMGGF